MTLTEITTAAEIRAALGVSKTELTDTALALPSLTAILLEELDDINALALTEWTRINALSDAARSVAETKFHRVAKLFATYAIAKHLLTAMPMFSVQSITDGKADFERFNESLADLKGGIESMYGSMRYRFGLALQGTTSAGTLVPTFSATANSITIGLNLDPVTNA